MDIIFIHDLKVDAIVGIYDWERKVPQEIYINVDMAWDASVAAESEDIKDALDYGAVSHRVRDFIVASKFLLLETLAEKTVEMIMQEFSVPWVSFSCAKTQALAGVAGVGVKIERGVC